MEKLRIWGLVLVFLAGFLTAGALLFIPSVSASTSLNVEQSSPQNHVDEDQILVYDDEVILNIEHVQWARIADTNSMDPLIDAGANALQIIPQSPRDIDVGDVVSYSPQGSPAKHVIHRIVFSGEDEKGTYYILKGDNNKVADPGKVRFEQIDRVLIGVIY